MKKFLFLIPVAALFMASCGSDSEETGTKSNELSPVTISATSGMNGTRAVWGSPQTIDGNTTISVKFAPGESMDIYEYGYKDGKQVFTNTDKTEYQSANFTGTWHKDGTRWAAVLPSGSANSVVCGEEGNTFNLTLPTEQTTQVTEYTMGLEPNTYTTDLTYPDPKANIMVASKDNHNTASCFLSPICSYIYFLTDTNIQTVKISTTGDNPLAGNVIVTTTSYEWDGWENFVNCISGITPTANVSKEITVHGAKVTRNGKEYYEYVACIFANTYANIKISTEKGKTIRESNHPNTFNIVNLYYLGNLDTSTISE